MDISNFTGGSISMVRRAAFLSSASRKSSGLRFENALTSMLLEVILSLLAAIAAKPINGFATKSKTPRKNTLYKAFLRTAFLNNCKPMQITKENIYEFLW